VADHALLSIRGLSKRYDSGVAAVEGFDLDVMPGEFVTLLGPSGSGKTSVLKMVAGFERPSAGDILLDGKSIVERQPHERGMGMVFQSYALFPHMTVAENVAFPLDLRRLPRDEIEARVRDILETVRLPDLGSRYPSQLSGGQQQRVALARAVVSRPRLVLMDEPLGALDRNLRERLKAEIKSVQQSLGTTVVYVTHDQDEALMMSDRIGVMRDGRLVQLAAPRELYASPADRFVAAFVGESNLLACRHEGRGRVQLADGSIVRPPPGEPAPAGEAWLLIRPEVIDVDASEQPRGSLAAVVHEAIFLGELTRYILKMGSTMVIAKTQNRGTVPLRPGDRVWLSWRPEDSQLLVD
jgi:putative spermidine/putrescine transport system ATP-binding protein